MFSLGLSSRTSTSSKQETPKRVIRARQDYIARETAELTFKKDDFFYVLSTPHEEDRWYEVTNPLSGERGLVPAFCFEVMETRQDRLNRINRSGSNASSTDGARSSLGIPHSLPVSNTLSGTHQQSVSRSNSGQYRRPSGANSPLSAEPTSAMPLRTRTTSIHQQQQQQQQRKYSQSSSSYGSAPMPSLIEPQATVLYDFEAANGNELTIREGEHLAIVAQSTGDWLIARSAQRGNVAGLVPSAYIQLHDHVTGAVVSDLRAYLNRYNMRLRSAVDWEKQQREAWTTNSAHSSVSASSELAAAAGHSLGQNTGGRTRMSSGSNSSYDDQSPTPRSSAGSFLPAAVNALQMSRNRALTSSSSTTTSSIAERSSFRQLHQGRQPSGNSQQHSASENFPRFHKDEIAEVGVPSFICKDGAYLFQVSLTFYTGDERNLYRTYEDFVACRSELHDYFPAET
ncbi:bud emergence protein 1, partial [Kickxella alabastrina]